MGWFKGKISGAGYFKWACILFALILAAWYLAKLVISLMDKSSGPLLSGPEFFEHVQIVGKIRDFFLIELAILMLIDMVYVARRVRDIGWPVIIVTLIIFALRFSFPYFYIWDPYVESDFYVRRYAYIFSAVLIFISYLILFFEPGASSRKALVKEPDKANP